MSHFPNPAGFKVMHRAREHAHPVPYVVELLDVDKQVCEVLAPLYIKRALRYPHLYFYFTTNNTPT